MNGESVNGGAVSSASVVNLNWHGIGTPPRRLEPGEDDVWVSTKSFERVLDLLVGRTDVQITFDDGNASDIEIALPRLVERRLNARFFVLAGRLGEPTRLDAAGVRELVASGMSIGSHGWLHRDWRRLNPDEAQEEIVRAPQVLSEVSGNAVSTVSIPFGSYDCRVLAQLRRTGVAQAYTSDGGPTRTDRWLQSRTSLRRDTTPEHVRKLIDEKPSFVARQRRSVVGWVKRHRP